MPEKKFDLNKALQAARLYTPIDYGYIPQFDISTSINDLSNTANNVLSDIDWIGSGVRARKEEQEKRDNTPWYSKLGYAAMSTPNPGDVPATSALAADRYMVDDVEGGKNIQGMQDTIGSIAGAAATLGPMGISGFADTAATYGLGHAIGSEALSWGTGAAGYHGFNKLGNWIDKTYGTNTGKWLPLVGSIAAGMTGYSGYLKGVTNSAKYAINNGIRGYKDFPNLQKVLYQYSKPSDIIEEAIPTKQLIYNNRGPESGMNTYFKTAKYARDTGSYNGKTIPGWQLPRGERMQKSSNVESLPEYAFIPKKINLYDGITPSPQSLKFVDDVNKGSYFARRQSLLPEHELVDFTNEYFSGNPKYKFIGNGGESNVYDTGSGWVLKFNVGQRISPTVKNWDPNYRGFEFNKSYFKSIKDLADDYKLYLKDLNKYWYSEPHYLAGYIKGINDLYYPVLSQRKMMPNTAHRTTLQNLQKKYMIGDELGNSPITKNNIFLENDLPIPIDAHSSNFMFDTDGVLRAIDIHRQGGKI